MRELCSNHVGVIARTEKVPCQREWAELLKGLPSEPHLVAKETKCKRPASEFIDGLKTVLQVTREIRRIAAKYTSPREIKESIQIIIHKDYTFTLWEIPTDCAGRIGPAELTNYNLAILLAPKRFLIQSLLGSMCHENVKSVSQPVMRKHSICL